MHCSCAALSEYSFGGEIRVPVPVRGLAQEVQDVRQKLKGVQTECEQLKAERLQLQECNAEMSVANTSLKQELEQLRTDSAKLLSQNRVLSMANSVLKRECDALGV